MTDQPTPYDDVLLTVPALLDPPPLLALAVLLAAAGGAYYFGLRRPSRHPDLERATPAIVPAVDERDELWGAVEPPRPQKRRYVYPSDRPAEITTEVIETIPLPPSGADERTEAMGQIESRTVSDAEPEPEHKPVLSPFVVQSRLAVSPPQPADASHDPDEDRVATDGEEGDDEISLTDLFRRRRPDARHAPAREER